MRIKVHSVALIKKFKLFIYFTQGDQIFSEKTNLNLCLRLKVFKARLIGKK